MNWRFALATMLLSMALGLGPALAAPSALVQVSTARPMQFTHTLRAYGTVRFASEASDLLSAPCATIVQQVLVMPGEQVQRGQILLRVRPAPAEQLQLQQAQIDLRFAEAEAQRLQSLRQRQLATNAQVQGAAQNLAKARALLANLQGRQAALQGGIIRAPITGVVSSVPVQTGDNLAAGQPFLFLNPASARVVVLGVEAEDLPQVHSNDKVLLQTLDRHSPNWSSRVEKILAQVDPNTRLAGVIVPIPAAAPVLPGTLLSARIVLAQRQALAIPDSAVLREHGRAYCFVDVQGKAQQRWLRTGWQEGKWIEVLQGLRPGEEVVSLGNYELRAGMALRIEGKS